MNYQNIYDKFKAEIDSDKYLKEIDKISAKALLINVLWVEMDKERQSMMQQALTFGTEVEEIKVLMNNKEKSNGQ